MLKKMLLGVGLSLMLPMAHAETNSLNAMTFQDQWEKPQVLDTDVNWVILSTSKAGGNWVKDALEEMGWKDLSDKKLLYVADISGMPSLISKYMAIPAMQDYAFPIALVQDEEQIETWPKPADDGVMVYELKQFKIVSSQELTSDTAVENFLKTL